MPLSIQEIEREIARLSVDDRTRLAAYILDSLEPADGTDSEVEAAWAREIEARVAAYERGEIESVPAEDVFAEGHRRKP